MEDRLPPIPADKMTKAQKQAVEELAAGPRGELIGPFIPSLRSPEFMTRLQRLGEYLRYENSLGPRLTEIVILLTAREWTQQFEWHVHAPIAFQNGVRPGHITAIAEGRRPAGLAEDEEIVYDFFMELQRNRCVSDTTYERTVRRFGERAIIDLTGTIGYYSTLAMIMNVARTPLPEGGAPALVPLPNG
jgi:4-carboxymuconolactone decarboxylase